MKKLVFNGNFVSKLRTFFLQDLKAREVEVVSNSIDEAYYTYNIVKTNKTEKIILAIKEDGILGDTTTVKASGEIIEQINLFME